MRFRPFLRPGSWLSSGVIWVPVLLLGAIFVAALPIVWGVTLTALAPWFGHLSQPLPMVFLHVLWMYPVLWCYSLISDPITKRHLALAKARNNSSLRVLPPGALVSATAYLIDYLVVIAMYCTIFTDLLGAVIAALITAPLYKLFLNFLEREIARQETASESESGSA